MIAEAKALADKLNSPSDWAIVGAAATIGAAVDGAINILPIPFFSPGVCALLAASSALSIKRGLESAAGGLQRRRRAGVVAREAAKCQESFEEIGLAEEWDDFKLDLELASDPSEAEAIIRRARSFARNRRGFAVASSAKVVRDYLPAGWFGGGESTGGGGGETS